MKIINKINIKIEESEVLRYLGYSKDKVKEPKKTILQVMAEEMRHADQLVKSKGIYHLFKIEYFSVSKKKIDLENHFSLKLTDSMVKNLQGVDGLAIGIVTIGHALENRISEYFREKEYSRGLILDAVGTVAVRYLSQYLISLICQETQKLQLITTKRFVPGTHEWDIKAQRKIFDIMPTERIGVDLTDSFMMVPAKSLSWAIGFGKHIANLTKDDNSCRICQAVNCQFRKIN
jgi:hypothetical protein